MAEPILHKPEVIFLVLTHRKKWMKFPATGTITRLYSGSMIQGWGEDGMSIQREKISKSGIIYLKSSKIQKLKTNGKK